MYLDGLSNIQIGRIKRRNWWIVRFRGRISPTQLDVPPPIPHIGPFWSKAEAYKRLWQWGYGFSR